MFLAFLFILPSNVIPVSSNIHALLDDRVFVIMPSAEVLSLVFLYLQEVLAFRAAPIDGFICWENLRKGSFRRALQDVPTLGELVSDFFMLVLKG